MNIRDTLTLQSQTQSEDKIDKIECVIVKTKSGYIVKSKDKTKKLGGPYKSRAEAVKRLQQIEYFKHQG